MGHDWSDIWQLLSDDLRRRRKLPYTLCHFGGDRTSRKKLNCKQCNVYRSICRGGDVNRATVFRALSGSILKLFLCVLRSAQCNPLHQSSPFLSI